MANLFNQIGITLSEQFIFLPLLTVSTVIEVMFG